MMPKATVQQICDMCELWHDPAGRIDYRKTRVRQRSKSLTPAKQRRSKRRRRAKPKPLVEPIRAVKKEVKSEVVKIKDETKAQELAFPVPTPAKGS